MQKRVEGQPSGIDALIALLEGAGVEVAQGTRKVRREGFTHAYLTVAVPAATLADATDAGRRPR